MELELSKQKEELNRVMEEKLLEELQVLSCFISLWEIKCDFRHLFEEI